MTEGRQGTGYMVLTLWSRWFFDVYIIYIDRDQMLPWHCDRVHRKRHYRINLEFGVKGRTVVHQPNHKGNDEPKTMSRLYLFRPDIQMHMVKKCDPSEKSSTWVFSIGWVLKPKHENKNTALVK